MSARILLCLALIGCASKPTGDLTAEQMSEVVVREQPALAACYQAGLDRTPYTHEFQVQAALHIRPDGSVAKVELDQTGLSGLGACVERSIRSWHFPQAQAETHASLPIVFQPKVKKELPPNVQLPPGFKVVQDDPSLQDAP